MNETEIIRRLDRIERLLGRLVKEAKESKKAPVWVRSKIIISLTGWAYGTLRTMRINGIVKARQVGQRYEYDATSIPTMFIKPQAP